MNKIQIGIFTVILVSISIFKIYSLKNIETFSPNYPEEVDIIIIDHGLECWIIDDKEHIKEFMEASKRLSEHIGGAPDWYILRFISDNKQNFSIPFDNISYPKKAINIINGYIDNEPKYFSYKEKEKGSFTDDIDYYLYYTKDDLTKVYIFDRELSETECDNYE